MNINASYTSRLLEIMQLVLQISTQDSVGSDLFRDEERQTIASVVQRLKGGVDQNAESPGNQTEAGFPPAQVEGVDIPGEMLSVGLDAAIKVLKGSMLSRDWLRAVINTMSGGVVVTDRDAKIILINAATSLLLGYQEADLADHPLSDLFGIPAVIGPHGPEVQTIVTKDGHHVPFSCSLSPVRGNNAEVEGYLCVFQAITGEDLYDSGQLLAELGANVPALLWVRDAGTNALLYANPLWENYLGQKPDIGKDFRQLFAPIHPQDKEIAQRIASQASTKSFEETIRFVDVRGAVRWFRVRTIPIDDTAGNTYRVLGIGEDVTERKQAEEALRNSEETARALLDSFPDATLLVDANGIVLAANQSAHQRSDESVIGKSLYDLFPVDLARKRMEDIAEVFRTRQPLVVVDEQAGWILENHFQPVFDVHGNVSRLAIFSLNITERYQLDAALKSSEERLHLAIQVGNIGIFDHDHRTDTVYWSPEYRAFWGWGLDEQVRVERTRDQIYPEDRERIDAAMQHAWDPKGDGRFDVELRVVRPGGAVRWLSTRSRTFFEGEGATRHPVRTVGATIDITERKRLEQDLLRTQFSMDHASVGVLWTGPKANILSVNPRHCQLLGYTAEELINMHIYDLDPNFPLETWVEHRANLRRAGSAVFETLHRRKDGTLIPVEVATTYIPFQSEDLAVSFVQDISERKQVRDALQASEERLQLSISVGNIGIFDHDHRTNTVYWSPELRAIYGWEKAESLPMEAIRNQTYFEDFERIDAAAHASWDPGGDGHFDVEHQIVDRHGSVHWVNTRSRTFFEGEGKTRRPIRTIGAVMDITRHRLTEEALRESEFFLQKSQSVGSTGSYYLDARTGVWICSPMLNTLFGIDPDFVKTVDSWISLVHPDDQAEMQLYFSQHILTEHNRFDKEYRIVRRNDGQVRWVHGLGELEFDSQGSPIKMIGTIQDITESKEAEAKLQVFQYSVDKSTDAIFWMTHDATFSYVNDQACRSLGYSRDELLHLKLWDIAVNYQKEAWEDSWAKGSTGGFYGESLHRRKDGSTFPVDISSTPLQFGTTAIHVAIARDITERKRQETALRQSEDFLQRSQNVALIGSYYFDIRTGIWISSPMLDRLFGIDSSFKKDVAGWISVIHPDDQNEMQEYLSQHVLTQRNRFDKEYRIIQLDTHEARWVHGLGELEFDDQGNVIRMIGTIQDITERKQKSEALEKSEARFRALVENSPDYISFVDRDYRVRYINWADTDGVVGKSIFDFMLPQYVELARSTFDSAVQTGKAGQYEYEVYSAEGPGWLSTRVVSIPGSDVMLVTTNINEFRRTEAALRVSEARLREAQEVGHIGTWDWNLSSNDLYWSEETYRIFGLNSADSKIDMVAFLAKVHPDDLDNLRRSIQLAIEGQPYSLSHRIIRPDGQTRWVEQHGQMVYDNRMTPIRIFGTTQDITLRKEAEEKLYTSEAKTRALLRAIPDAIFSVDDSGVFVDSKLPDNFELLMPPDEFIGKSIQDILPSEIAPQTLQRITLARQTGKPQVFEYALSIADNIHHYEARIVSPERGNNYIIVRDVTERKLAEVEQQKLSTIVESGPDLIGVASLDGHITYMNPAGLRLLGLGSLDAVRGKHITEFLLPRDLEMFAREMPTVMERGSWIGEFQFRTFDTQQIIPVEMSVFLIRDAASGNPLALANISRDITERKQSEERIRKLNEELEQRVIERTRELEEANAEIRHFAYIVSHDLRAPLVNLKGFSSELRADLSIVREVYDEVGQYISPTKRDRLLRAVQEEIPESLRFIDSSVENMDSLTKAILKLSRLGRVQIDLVEIDVRSIVEKTLAALSHQIKQNEIKVTIGALPTITADFVSMEQIIGNILTNAIAYLEPGRPGQIDISATQEAAETTFSIRDNGRGIAVKDADKVFAPFRRAGKQDVPGEGMGLAYVQALVRRHGGRIWYDSEVGVGTTFHFTIPRTSP